MTPSPEMRVWANDLHDLLGARCKEHEAAEIAMLAAGLQSFADTIMKEAQTRIKAAVEAEREHWLAFCDDHDGTSAPDLSKFTEHYQQGWQNCSSFIFDAIRARSQEGK